ncbi:allophanate hydrolase [Desulfogranum japonicum]|uniref:allophanate hydrolase n=1 Tax=Desulfogranum japonicum TaxID=231447 RepID=UPI00040390C5|nr:allophanate hydrolase [Desulfogranum japonicum]
MNLCIHNLKELYRKGSLTPEQLCQQLLKKCKEETSPVWIYLLSENELEPYLNRLKEFRPDELPLYGVPFAIKDNIDLALVPTTAGCPAYAYTPQKSAFVVQRLIDAGAIPLGKTNLDQFATGLVGVRSPYGAVNNSFVPEYVSGGSSSGSAVAVAKAMCSFSLGTDTAGSGRVPAAFNNIFGVKPTKGLLSNTGVVPACRSLDCVSIFAGTAEDGERVLSVAAANDEADPFSRKASKGCKPETLAQKFTYGVPQKRQLEFFGNKEYEQSFYASLELLDKLGGKRVEIDFSSFLDAAKLLYEGPWVEERTVAVGDFIKNHLDESDPVVAEIVAKAKSSSGAELFQAIYTLQAYKSKSDTVFESVDLIVTPTAGTCYTIEEVQADPIRLNSNLGYYTNYMNLLDYCSLAVPTAITSTVPFGITLVGRAFTDEMLLELGEKIHQLTGLPLGAGTEQPVFHQDKQKQTESDVVLVAVCGAHLQGLPLHHQLQALDATFIEKTTTSKSYMMFALETKPPKPGLIRNESKGRKQVVEVYSLSKENFGSFVSFIPHPLGIGKLELADGSWVSGFIAEPVVVEQGGDITSFGGWRNYLSSL